MSLEATETRARVEAIRVRLRGTDLRVASIEDPDERVAAVLEACSVGGVEVDGARAWHGVQIYILIPGPEDYVPGADQPFPRYDLRGKFRIGLNLGASGIGLVLEAAHNGRDVLAALADGDGTCARLNSFLEANGRRRVAK